jgi:2-polyprenyl-6-methoxyphenol hydroxylase-like FAD-dependent oxidoreductase
MKVLISGAGPAGLTAADWLKRYGFNPTIGERAPSRLAGELAAASGDHSTERITKAANAICLKDYSSFLRPKEAPS